MSERIEKHRDDPSQEDPARPPQPSVISVNRRPLYTVGIAVLFVLFVLVVPVFTFFVTPLGALWSRRHEFEADAFASSHASAGELATALVKLHRDNASTLTPDPVYAAFYY